MPQDTIARPHTRGQVIGLLRLLLPDPGTDSQSPVRTLEEMARGCGLESTSPEFDRLLRLLRDEIKLIAAVGPGSSGRRPEGPDSEPDGYRIAHDYLVGPLRAWVTREINDTPKGRAELILALRTNLWLGNRRISQLPTLLEWWSIRREAGRIEWTDPRRAMMRAADLYQIGRGLLVSGILAIALMATWRGWLAWDKQRAQDWANDRVAAVYQAPIDQLDAAIEALGSDRAETEPLLQAAAREKGSRTKQLRAGLALLRPDDTPVAALALADQLLEATPAEIPVVCRRLAPWREPVATRLLQALRGGESAIRAGVALATLDPGSPNWTTEDIDLLTDLLLKVGAEERRAWWDLARPLARSSNAATFGQSLRGRFHDELLGEAATLALLDLFGDDAELLSSLLPDADSARYRLLWSAIDRGGPIVNQVRERMQRIAKLRVRGDPPIDERIELGKLRALAAAVLIRLRDYEGAFQALEVDDDPEPLTQFIHRVEEWQVSPSDLVDALRAAEVRDSAQEQIETDEPTINPRLMERVRYGLILALGEYPRDHLGTAKGDALIARLIKLHRDDPSSAIHSASAWLVRVWGNRKEIAQIEKTEQTPIDFDRSGRREWFVLRIKTRETAPPDRSTHEYFTFLVIPTGPQSAVALADRELTAGHLKDFADEFRADPRMAYLPEDPHTGFRPGPDDPASLVTPIGVFDYCVWLTVRPIEPPQTLSLCYTLSRRDLRPPYLLLDSNRQMKLDSRGFRLPIMLEWQWACRAGMGTRYSFGSDTRWLGKYAWYGENARDGSGMATPRPVARLRPNLRGFFDMHGNVRELCHGGMPPKDDDQAGGSSRREFNLQEYEYREKAKKYFSGGGGFSSTANDCQLDQEVEWDNMGSNLESGVRLALPLPPVNLPKRPQPAKLTKRLDLATEAPVKCLIFSPDGTMLALGRRDGDVELRRVADGALAGVLKDEGGSAVTCIAFNADGSLLAVGKADAKVRLWQVADCRRLRVLDGHRTTVVDLAFSPDGQTLYTAGDYQSRGFSDKEILDVYKDHPEVAREHIAWNRGTSSVVPWKVSDGTQAKSLDMHQSQMFAMVLSPDGQTIATASFYTDRDTPLLNQLQVKLWRTEDHRPLHKFSERDKREDVRLAFHPGGDLLASGGEQIYANLYRVSEPVECGMVPCPRRPRSVSFSADGQFLSVAGSTSAQDADDTVVRNGTVGEVVISKLGDTSQARVNAERFVSLKDERGGFRQATFGPKDLTLATIDVNDRVAVWRLELSGHRPR